MEEPRGRFWPPRVKECSANYSKASLNISVPYLVSPLGECVPPHSRRVVRGLHISTPSETETSSTVDSHAGFCSVRESLTAERSLLARNTWRWEAGNGERAQSQPKTHLYKTRHIPPTERAIALEMIRWVIYAARPLHTGELLDAIRTQMMVEISESDIDKLCCGFLTKTKIGNAWASESSAREFLESQDSEKTTLSSRIISTASHEMMAAICLKKLDHNEILARSNASNEVNMSEMNTDTSHQDLLFYARHHWRFHYAQAESQSYFLSGMLHEKLRDDQKYGYRVFFSEISPLPTETGNATERSSSLAATSFLNAALHEGVRSNMVKLVKLELEMGASPNALDAIGNTPLHIAATTGNLKVVELLVSYRGNINIRSRRGDTPLSLAVGNGHIETFKLLLSSESMRKATYKNTNIGWESMHCTYQKLSLLVSRKICCCSCESRFVLSRIPDSEEDKELWSPIIISTKSKSKPKCRRSTRNGEHDCSDITTISEQMTTLKWFSGIHMYNALGKVANRGIEDVLRLLVLAGNNIEFLQLNKILSEIMSKMKIE